MKMYFQNMFYQFINYLNNDNASQINFLSIFRTIVYEKECISFLSVSFPSNNMASLIFCIIVIGAASASPNESIYHAHWNG